MHHCSVNRHGLFGRDIRAILQVVVLSFLLGLEPQSCKSSQILLRNGLVHRGTPTNTFSVVVCNRNPPVGLALDVSKNDIFNWSGETGYLPRNVTLPASPSFRKMLKNRVDLVLFDTFRHHIHEIRHDRSPQFKVEMRFHTLLGDGLGNALAMTTLELAREQVSEPSLKEGDDTTHEEQPNSPGGGPETATRTLTDRPRVETVVNQMLQILARTDLMHQFVLVTIHTGQLPDMVEGVEDTICQLESIDVAQAVLNLGIDDQLGQTQNFSHQMERISKTRLLSLFGGQGLDRFQVEVVVQVQVSQVLAVDQQVEHVETLAADLKTRFNPVDCCLLEELGRLQCLEQVLLVLGLGLLLVQFIEHI